MKTGEIHIRDPFVLADNGRYILIGTTDEDCWNGGNSFLAYESEDLINWTLKDPVFERRADFWGTVNFWAPEMYKYKGEYYLFASFKAPDRCRATCALKASSPLGPFEPFGAEQLTPADWECLDGTLYVDKQEKPWLAFCHEWLQVSDGEMCALPLKEDLSGADGEPTLLFRASEAPWVLRRKDYVTDGPFLFTDAEDKLCMLWSSIGAEGYTTGIAVSENGVSGPWKQQKDAFYTKDGGHAMLFTTFDGQLMMSLHSPNPTPQERPLFVPVEKSKNGLRFA